ncbi:MAG: CPBP family intramembrane glutamic endopeptidase [Patescibacteria group bacterium]
MGLWWPIVLVPIWQEFLFRYFPYTLLYLPFGRFWEIGVVSNIIFAAIHWYLGKWFILWAFFWGMVLWWVIGRHGILAAILIHSLINIIDFHFGIRKLLQKLP